MTGDTPVSTLPFVGPKYEKLLANLGIKTIRDLLYHLPTRYIDLSKMTPIAELEAGETQVVSAKLWDIKSNRIGGGRVLVQATVADETGTIQLTWFNQPYIEKSLRRGEEYRFAGEVELKFGRLQMTNPTHELAAKPMVHTGRLVPVYPQTAGVSSKWLRARIAPLLPRLDSLAPDFLPTAVIDRQKLLPLDQALFKLHNPSTLADAHQARHRLGFDELLLLQLAALQRKNQWQAGRQAPRLPIVGSQLSDWLQGLPFELTEAQRQVLDEILADMDQTTPMNRLVEGDVGSGKTVVALMAGLAAVNQGFQVAVMAPTSVLAQQHFLTFQSLVETLGRQASSVKRQEEFSSHPGAEGDTISFGTTDIDPIHTYNSSEVSASLQDDGKDEPTYNRKPHTTNRRQVTISLRTAKSKSEPADITVGTHALISEGLNFDKLGLVIIDEQHRFGVEQRAQLMAKAGGGVHVLSMTATPIPRTLALTAYGDLNLSIIDQMPANRLPIKTHIVPQRKRADMEGYLRQAMERGEQVYVVCPLIEESDKITEVRAATAEFDRLQKVFPNHRLALLHGKMKAADKDQVLADFKGHQFDLLVATPVVEVGIDVPNATMLVIEGAERFGLAQLHQLRGRVGRGKLQSYCFLLSDATDAKDIQRLQHLEHETSGIRLAELDLATRGPGEVYGLRQSGLPELKAASFMDVELVQAARAEAERLVVEPINERLAAELERTQRMVELN